MTRDDAQLKQDNFFFRMQLQDKINELKAAAPHQTAIQKQEEMQAYWRNVLTLNGLNKEKAPTSEAEKPLTQQLWITL